MNTRNIGDSIILIMQVLLITSGCAVFAGAYWGVVDWLRNFGSDLTPWPYFAAAPPHWQAAWSPVGYPILIPIHELIGWYNVIFKGATRFGSGLGIIFGSLLAIYSAPRKPIAVKLPAVIVVGFLIGGRSWLMVSSDTRWALSAAVMGGCVGCLLLALAHHDEKMQPPEREDFTDKLADCPPGQDKDTPA